MEVWLVTVGEVLPFESKNAKMLRTGMLAAMLAEKGHKVTWWTSSLNHAKKIQRSDTNTTVSIKENYRINILHAPAYTKNISARRLINHFVLERNFTEWAEREESPDIILCSFPTIELSYAATNFGKARNIPVILDVRDLWPDIILELAPETFRTLTRMFLGSLFRKTKHAFKNADAITAVSQKYREFGLAYAERGARNYDRVFPIGYKEILSSNDELLSAKKYFNEIGVQSEKFICWFVGSFARTYDLETVILAAQKLHREGNEDFQFVLCGDGEKTREWKTLANGLPNVIFPGWINQAQMNYLHSITTAGLMAYAKDAPQGHPNKLFEYLAAGLPIVSSLQGETAELLALNECGMTYQANCPSSLLDVLLFLYENPGMRAKMGERGRALYAVHYDADKIYAEMAQFLESFVANGKSQK